MSVWSIDADDMRLEDFDISLLYETPSIKLFLNNRRDTKHFICAPKGAGKTFILTAKRISYQKKSINCLPENSLLDTFSGDTVFNKEMITLLNDPRNWSHIWKAAILIAVLKKIDCEMEDSIDSLKGILTNRLFLTVSENFIEILHLVREKRDYYFALTRELNALLAMSKKITSTIAIFIDRVDEFFSRHIDIMRNDTKLASSTSGELDPNIWYQSQIGLMLSIYEISRSNHHIKIFASIRKEVLLNLVENSHIPRQLGAPSIDLNYTIDDLKEMFIGYIKREDKKNLAIPDLLKTDPLMAFLGVECFNHNSVKNVCEDSFAYIYRHSLLRPRDFMAIGSRISLINKNNRNETTIKNEIDDETIKTINEYLNIEIYPHYMVFRVDDIANLLPSNVIDCSMARDICAEYNNFRCSDTEDCKKCIKTHIFCILYEIGLLGILKKNLVDNEIRQEFVMVGRKPNTKGGILPDSKYYLLHPVLYNYIHDKNKSFQVDIHNVVGYGYRWKNFKNKSKHGNNKVSFEKITSIDNDVTNDENIAECLMALIEEMSYFEAKDERPGTGESRIDIKIALATIIDIENAILLDLGCGNGPLVNALLSIDKDQLKTLTYYGVNFEETDEINKYIDTTGFRGKVKKCKIYNIDDFSNLTIKSNCIFIIDVLHHLNPTALYYYISLANKNLAEEGKIIILESEKHREVNTFLWTSDDLRFLFKGYDFVKIFAQDSNNDGGNINNFTTACVKKIKRGKFSESFRKRCISLYKRKHNDLSKHLRDMQKNNKKSIEETEEISRYMVVVDKIANDIKDSEMVVNNKM